MKQNILKLIVLTIFTTSLTIAQAQERISNPVPAERIATNMINTFDSDDSAALNKLELSGAIEYLSQVRPGIIHALDFVSLANEESAPPKIAYGLVEGFDSDSDYQLTREELTLAIDYLRKLNRNNLSAVALAD